MRRYSFFPLVLASVSIIGFLQSRAQETKNETRKEVPADFVLRVNPQWADKVNQVLKRVAPPIEVILPAGSTSGDLARRLCAGHEVDSPAPIENEPGKLRLFPCVNIRTGVQVTVHEGNTLEEIAVRNGLPASAGPRLKLARPNAAALATPETIKPGDIVTIPEVPLWTGVIVNPDLIKDRKAMVEAVAAAVNCKQGDLDECLHTRGIYVLDGAGAKHPPEPTPPPKHAPSPQAPPKREPGLGMLDLGRLRPVYEMYAADAAPPPPAPAAPALRLPSPAISIPVAESQWPYDADLLAAIFQDLHDPLPLRGIVGVADAGLADAAGGPLPPDLFDHSNEERPIYVNDVIGAGVPRSVNVAATGDVSLCGGPVQPPFSSWDAAKLELASHGSIVASLAGGLPLRRRNAALNLNLPRVVFFRMAQKVCDPESDIAVGEGEMATAFDYLKDRTRIVVISYMKSTDQKSTFPRLIKDDLIYGEMLLVLPSGQIPPGDLDNWPFSPQNLASADPHTSNRTIVVGSATRQLTRSGDSNYGDGTVSLYAPGEPVGALNVAGADASAFKPATSYAAPQVAFAAAILHSFGYTAAVDIKDRLAAATWPLSGAAQSRIGVVDLVKVAAVRHHAVEVIEPAPDGSPVRRTYVGKLKEKLSDLTVCNGYHEDEGSVHAIRFDGIGPDRPARLYMKNAKVQEGQSAGRRIIFPIPSCRSQGEIHLDALPAGSGLKTFQLTSVTQIQFPWVPRQ